MTEFSFVVEGEPDEIVVGRGQYVAVPMSDGLVIARVQNLLGMNRYYQHAEAVREYQSHGEPLRTIFPTDRWQYTVAETRVLGYWRDGRSVRPYFVVPPGSIVRPVDESVLSKFLGLDPEHGLKLGRLTDHEIDFCPTLQGLLSKHMAILAMSGAGKSYFVSVLIEELLSRREADGRLATVLVDVHGEYSYLTKMTPNDLGLPEGSVDIDHIRGSHIQIPVNSLSAETLASFVSDMSPIQLRDLRRVLTEARNRTDLLTLSDIATIISEDGKISKNTRDALVGWILGLEDTGLFGKEALPELVSSIRPGRVTLIDLSDFVSMKKKQIIVSYLAGELLNLRRRGLIPPFLLILEEAHQFCPEGRHELALPRPQIETIAREGRKFFALLCLVSQRPVRLSTTVLSQCNTHAIFRTTNPYDLEHIGRSSEGIDKESLEMITTLSVGEALFVGEAVTVPTFVRIRKRKFEPESAKSLEETLRAVSRQWSV
ncbi:MAG: ATP-binding protein [Candidatus Thorarchaeota archaeon]